MKAQIEAEAARQGAREVTDPNITDHARERFGLRARAHPDDVQHAWKEAAPVHYPSESNGNVVRYHSGTGLLLIAAPGTTPCLVTCISLDGRPAEEQEYIKSQVSNL